MAPLVNFLRRFGRARSETVRECRQCGTTVDSSADDCPSCDSAEIATYRIAG